MIDNTLKFKPGDAVMFMRDICTEPASGRQVLIPKLVPCTITKMNKHHVWIMYRKRETMLRLIEGRMIPATEAGVILFGDKPNG